MNTLPHMSEKKKTNTKKLYSRRNLLLQARFKTMVIAIIIVAVKHILGVILSETELKTMK